jgi:hypothetical protein
MKPGQIFRRIGKRLGMKCALPGAHPARHSGRGYLIPIPELDFDPVFLSRFDPEALMRDLVTLLHITEHIDWESRWLLKHRTPLWNFNLHYFEYLHPLTKFYLDTGNEAALRKTIQMICGWIHQNPPEKGGVGWTPYTVSLRLTNWLAYIAAVGDELDTSFRGELEESMYGQYVYLSEHLEKDILGNHYFENLKTLVLCSLFFGDAQSLPIYLDAFRKECREEILPDGMHFELSPMYHKIVLEGLLRVAATLRYAGMPDSALEGLARDMLDAADTLEHGLSRIPLFNDCGDNVAKSLDGLLAAAKKYLGLNPVPKKALPDSGYYVFEKGPWKLIVDAGRPGPDYIPGHSHCDAMSFELFRDGLPVLVNCGTYAYQCAQRPWFRSTQAHNTVQTAGVEQSEIWSTFRLARRSRTKVTEVLENGIRMEMTDYRGNRIRREILLAADSLYISDTAEGLELQSHLHSIRKIDINCSVPISRCEASYAPEYGLLQTVHHYTATGSSIEWRLPLD